MRSGGAGICGPSPCSAARCVLEICLRILGKVCQTGVYLLVGFAFAHQLRNQAG